MHQRITDIVHIADDTQFLLAREVVADVVVIDTRCLVGCLRFLDQNCNGNRGAGARTEDLATLLTRQFSAGALVAAQIEDIDGRKLFFNSFTESGSCIAI